MWQTVIARLYVDLSVVLALVSTRLGKWKESALLEIVGAVLIGYAFVAAHMVITNRLADFNIAMKGSSLAGQGVSINTKLQLAYTMAYISGETWLGLAVLRSVIAKKWFK